MKQVIRRGVINGLVISFWYLAFCAAPHLSGWISHLLWPDVYFNMR